MVEGMIGVTDMQLFVHDCNTDYYKDTIREKNKTKKKRGKQRKEKK